MAAALDLETHDEPLARERARAERIQALADEVAAQADADGLSPPVEANWLAAHLADTDAHVFALRWFNPFGPTHLEFVLKGVPGRDESLLVANQCHPFSPAVWALGLIVPERHGTPERLAVLLQAFARREAARESRGGKTRC